MGLPPCNRSHSISPYHRVGCEFPKPSALVDRTNRSLGTAAHATGGHVAQLLSAAINARRVTRRIVIGIDRTFGIAFPRCWKTEIGENTISEKPCDRPMIPVVLLSRQRIVLVSSA
jgi:hypothetical protein